VSRRKVPDSPFKGLMPYAEDDGAFFFGREREQEIIISNLMASRLTLLYGVSGAGKSSVLRAGVAYQMRQLAREEVAAGRAAPEFLTVVFNSWGDPPLPPLKQALLDAVGRANPKAVVRPASPGRATLADLLGKLAGAFKTHPLVILDQFEEYFLYHPEEDAEGTFASEFAQAVNRPGLRANFLISLREDSLAKLDRFKGRIHGLFDNYLRIERLDFEAARAAVTKPLVPYNKLLPANRPKVGIEPELVEAVLKQVRVGQVVLGEAGRGVARPPDSASQIETPYLQLVLKRLWREEQRADSPVMRLKTLEELGGAEKIVRAHLDECMGDLGTEGRATAAIIFDRLVTPSGTKIAHTVRDLAAYTQVQEESVAHILDELASGDARILRRVSPPPERPGEPRYEIFHDVLSHAILGWRAEFLQANKQAVEERQQAREMLERNRAERERERLLEAQEMSPGFDDAEGAGGGEKVRLDLTLVRGDITKVSAPVLAVGHYRGVPAWGVMSALDEALGYWISRALEQKLVGGSLGELFFIPVTGGGVRAQAVLLAGMGEPGTFTPHDLRYLMRVVTYAVSTLGLKTFASVLVGSGAGGLSLERALRCFIAGAADALRSLPPAERLKGITLVESDAGRYEQMQSALQAIGSGEGGVDLRTKLTKHAATAPRRKDAKDAKARPYADRRTSKDEVRLIVERAGDVFRFSAITLEGVLGTREVEVQATMIGSLSERLMTARTLGQQEEYGVLLRYHILPPAFVDVLDQGRPVTLVVNQESALLPWEMLCYPTAGGVRCLGTDNMLTRQFPIGALAPALAPRLDRTLKVLLIANPASGFGAPLPGLEREGRQLLNLFSGTRAGLDARVTARIGPHNCDPVEILGLLMKEDFDIIHFAGYVYSDPNEPSRGGLVFGKDLFVSVRELFRTHRVPRLFFANAACISPEARSTAEADVWRGFTTLAQAFLERGIPNFIGVGGSGAVEDDAAIEFASTFYHSVLSGETLGGAMEKARVGVRKNHPGTPSWGFYQHYGRRDDLLVPAR
jgi:hypothetical protein